MTTRIRFAIVLAAAVITTPARAEPPYPKVDFQGDWVLSDDQGNIVRAEMHYSAAQRKMRVDMKQQGMEMTSVRDMETGETIMWSSQMPGMGMRLPSIKDEDYEGERTDEIRTVNGEICTIWKMEVAEACLTEDNIPLEVTAEGFSSGLENFERTSQDAAIFAVPDGLTIMDMPANLPGAGAGGMGPGKGLPF